MNMILHGIEAPNIQHTNTRSRKTSPTCRRRTARHRACQPAVRWQARTKEVQQNFLIRTGEQRFGSCSTSSNCCAGGRAAIVIKNRVLSNTDNASVSLRKQFRSKSCNLHTVLDCPGGTFLGAGVKPSCCFSRKAHRPERSGTTSDPGRNMGKTNPLNDADLAEFIALQNTLLNRAKLERGRGEY